MANPFSAMVSISWLQLPHSLLRVKTAPVSIRSRCASWVVSRLSPDSSMENRNESLCSHHFNPRGWNQRSSGRRRRHFTHQDISPPVRYLVCFCVVLEAVGQIHEWIGITLPWRDRLQKPARKKSRKAESRRDTLVDLILRTDVDLLADVPAGCL